MFTIILVSLLLESCFGLQSYYTTSGENDTIERPCAVYDLYCIRNFLSKHSDCNVSYGPVPEPYYRPQTTMYLPSINLTITSIQIELKGLNGRIEEFYVNRDTKNVVLSIEFKGLSIFSNNSYFKFHRVGREPIVTVDYLYELYQSIVTTMIIPNNNGLKLEESEIFAYVNDLIPVYSIGPGIADSTDPIVLRTLSELNTNVPLLVREGKLSMTAYFAAIFVQHNLCNFGLKVF